MGEFPILILLLLATGCLGLLAYGRWRQRQRAA